MSAISWNPSYPASGSAASEGDDAFRSLMTNFATGVGEFIYFPSSGASQGASTASTGEPRLGTARAARLSNVSGGVGNGYLGFETSKGGLWHTGSSWTYAPLGHPGMLEGAAFNAPFTYRWVHLYGWKDLGSGNSGSQVIPFREVFGSLRTTTFNAPPIVTWTMQSADTLVSVGVLSSTTNITSVWSSRNAGTYSKILWFESVGTVNFGTP